MDENFESMFGFFGQHLHARPRSEQGMRPVRTETAHEGAFVDLQHKHFELPDGTRSVYEVAHPKSNAVVILPVRMLHGTAEVALVKQFRPAIVDHLWEFPAGKIDLGETPAETAGRECTEELGLRPTRLQNAGSFYSSPGLTDELLYFYIASDFEIVGEPEPGIEVQWVSMPALLNAMSMGQIRDMKTGTGVWIVEHFFLRETSESNGGQHG